MRGRGWWWAGVVLLAPGAASAQVNFDNYCVTGSFQACSSVRVQSLGNTLTMQVWNLQGTLGDAGHAITSIGLYHASNAWNGSFSIDRATFVTPESETDITEYWQRKPGEIKTLGGIDIEVASGTSDKRGVIGCAQPTIPEWWTGPALWWATCNTFPTNPYVEIEFSLTQAFAMDELEVRWRSEWLPDGSSLVCDSGGAGGNNCAPVPIAVVPEPVTSVLFLTGAAGMAGMRALRRRRRDPLLGEIDEEA